VAVRNNGPDATPGTSVAFGYYAPGQPTSIVPPLAPLRGGTRVTVVGTNLIGSTASRHVAFGSSSDSVHASFNVGSGGVFECLTPTATAVAGTVVAVEVSHNGVDYSTAAASVLFEWYAMPTVASVQPQWGVATGGVAAKVTLQGAFFVPAAVTAVDTCRFDSVEVAATSVTASAVVCTAPSTLAVGSYAVDVSHNGVDFTDSGVQVGGTQYKS
jgi:hypothetical protein